MDESRRSQPGILAPPRVVPVPSGDQEYVRYVRQQASSFPDAAGLEEQLRRRYPRARVRPNELSGRDAVLYAYRDGHWEPGRSA